MKYVVGLFVHSRSVRYKQKCSLFLKLKPILADVQGMGVGCASYIGINTIRFCSDGYVEYSISPRNFSNRIMTLCRSFNTLPLDGSVVFASKYVCWLVRWGVSCERRH